MPHPFVLITGCSSGIGLAAAKALGAHGFTVIASARKVEDVATQTEEASAIARKTAQSAESMSKTAHDMQQLVTHFRI